MGHNFNLATRVKTLANEFSSNKALDEEGRKLFYRAKYETLAKNEDVLALAQCMYETSLAKEYVDMLSKHINAEYDVLRLELIPTTMEEKGIENMKIEEIGRVGLTGDMYVSVKAGCHDQFFAWLKKNKLGDLIQSTINPSTLKSFVRTRMAANKKVPSDLLNVTPYTRASITKS